MAAVQAENYKEEELLRLAKESEIEAIIQHYHKLNNHRGMRKTHKLIASQYAKLPYSLVTKFVATCSVCQQTANNKPKNQAKLKPILASGVFERLVVA